jgi:HK97 family phage major capsid protein
MPFNNVISRSEAQALIPEQVVNTMLDGLQNDAAALQAFTRVPVGTNQTRFPVLSALPVAYFVGGDTGLKQTTEANWANKFLNIEEIAAIVPIPEAVLDDTAFDIWGQITPLMQNAIARTLDAAVFFGVNAPGTWPTSVVASAVAAGNVVARGTNTQANGGIVGDLSDVAGQVEADGFDPNTWLANINIRGRLRQARSTQGEALDDVFAEELRSQTMYPMRGLWPTGLSAAEVIAMDRREFVLGVRQDVTYKILDQAVIQDNTGAIVYNLAQQDMVAMRVVFRVGWQVANTINYDNANESARYPASVLRSPAS